MKVGIIILHYGDIAVTKACVTSICRVEKIPYEIIMVNNDKLKITKKTFGKTNNIIVINNEKNLGFAAGVNVGIRYALKQKMSYILLLNNDTKLNKPILKKLAGFLKRTQGSGIVGAAIEFYKDHKKTYDVGGNLNPIFGRTDHTEVNKITNISPRKTTYVTGACMMIKMEIIKKIGLLDEQFFLYYEDVDFCLRAKKEGYSSYVLPSIVISHSLSKTVGKVSALGMYHQTKSAVLFGKKYCKNTRLFNLIFIFAQSCLFILKKKSAGFITFRAMKDGLL